MPGPSSHQMSIADPIGHDPEMPTLSPMDQEMPGPSDGELKMVVPVRRESRKRRFLADPISAVIVIPDEGDEQERTERRSFVTIQRRSTHISTVSSVSSITDGTSSMGKEQLEEHLRMCARLYAANKISAKNVWEIHVIDAMRRIAATSSNPLKVATSSLDIGAKVYGLRVDDLHARSLQLASRMNAADGASQRPQTRTKRSRRRVKRLAADKRNTVDHEERTLYAPIKRLQSTVFNVSSTDDLLTERIERNPGTRQFMLMSSEKYWPLQDDVTLQERILDIHLPQPTTFEVCATLKGFEIGAWDPDDDQRFLDDIVVLDDAGVPVAELDGPIPDIFQNVDNLTSPVRIGTQIERVETVPAANDYSFNPLILSGTGRYIDKLWAGPHHWKVKFMRPSPACYSGRSVEKVGHCKRKTKEAQKINFEEVNDDEDVGASGARYQPRRAATTVPWTKITLPSPGAEAAAQWFLRATKHSMTKPDVAFDGLLKETQQYSHCGSTVTAPSDDNEPGPSFSEQQLSFVNDNLAVAPEVARATPLPYAMRAKKINMKMLERAIFRIITEGDEEIFFSRVYRRLRQLLPPESRRELTCPLAVVALLHLCNEENLLLENINGDNKDFLISTVTPFYC